MFPRILMFLILLASGLAAKADTFQFEFSGYTANYLGIVRMDTFSFQLDTASLTNGVMTPTEDPRFWELTYFIPATVNGVAMSNLQMYERDIFGPGPESFYDGFYIDNVVDGNWTYFFYSSYPNFLYGDVNEPLIVPGTYRLDGENYVYGAPATGKLVVTDLTPVSAVPESSSFELLTTGLLAILGLRRRCTN